MWERTYAVTETKRCVEGAAGTSDADKTIGEPLRKLSGRTPTAFDELAGCIQIRAAFITYRVTTQKMKKIEKSS